MVSFLDVANIAHRTVEVRGVQMPVYGISGKGLISILDRFPEVRDKWVSDGATVSALFTLDDVKQLGPRVIAAILAAGIGKPGDEAEEEEASKLSLGEQGELLIAVMEASFPRGLGPFVAKLRELGFHELANSLTLLLLAPLPDTGKAPDTTTPPLSNAA